MDNKISLLELEEKVIKVIKTVYDPEIPVDIYELGLIYDIQITENREVIVLMTLTAPNCPEAEYLPVELQEKIKRIPEVKDSRVLITFEPPYNRTLLSESAKLALGIL